MRTLSLEDIAVDTFLASSFGTFVMRLFQGLFTAPSWQSFSLLACGWTLTVGRHTITTYLWLTGAASVKHFSRFYVFLGCSLYQARWKLWAHIIHHAAHWVPPDAPIVIEVDDSTKKKAGAHIEGVDRYRNGAGSARQEYRTLRGVNFVWAIMRVPLPLWPGHCLSVPIGLSLYLKEALAHTLKVPYRSRSALAREIIDFVATELPGRRIRVLADGGYATKEVLRGLPPSVDVVSRMLITGKLYERPSTLGSRRGRPPQKGKLLGSPTTFARTRQGWQPHPNEARAQVQAWEGLWHTVLPGRRLRVVVVHRPATKRAKKPGQRKPPPPVEAFFTTDLSLSLAAILDQYRDRWAVEIEIRDANAFDGLGQDQCRKWQRLVGANTLRLVMAAARTLWFMEHARQAEGLDLCRYRPWYRQKCAPSQLDIVWACRETLHEAGVFPIPRFIPDLTENHEEPEPALPLAA
jgi:DDE superfamily endonuclease